jgi:hypothetical protein
MLSFLEIYYFAYQELLQNHQWLQVSMKSTIKKDIYQIKDFKWTQIANQFWNISSEWIVWKIIISTKSSRKAKVGHRIILEVTFVLGLHLLVCSWWTIWATSSQATNTPFIGSQYMMISARCAKCCMRFSTGCIVAKEHICG